jgi:hypothetical protein
MEIFEEVEPRSKKSKKKFQEPTQKKIKKEQIQVTGTLLYKFTECHEDNFN